jgi:short-subunit dehydrogenase
MNKNELSGKTALVTGASSGLGSDFAIQLADMGCNVILVARRNEQLEKLKLKILEKNAVDVTVIPMDLTSPDAPRVLYDQIKEIGKNVDVLINNAGYGIYGYFTDVPWEKEKNMLELDIISVVHLTKLFVADMLKRDFGYILQVASIGAYQPSPTYATYAAAKSFVLHFGEALNYELRNTHVNCTVLSPGITATEFLKVSGQKATLYQRVFMMQSADVVSIALGKMLKGAPSVVAGFRNALSVWFNRFLPRQWTAMASYLLMRTNAKA